jgi:hypothetical protein
MAIMKITLSTSRARISSLMIVIRSTSISRCGMWPKGWMS